MVLGMASFWRSDADPFGGEDLAFAEELAARAAVAVDNARRYTREHTLAETLQRSLLPSSLPDHWAVEVAHRYLPALEGVGGDWFDVIPLPGARVALVVGRRGRARPDAAATMGQLRTAVHNFSALDLPPDELLGHLDELVARIDSDENVERDNESVSGATCLYAIYDPASGTCALARSGHPEPALVRPDGTVEFLRVPGSPPLGLGGGLPFETTEFPLPRAPGWSSTQMACSKTGNGASTPASRDCVTPWRTRTGHRRRPARTSSRRCYPLGRATTSPCSWPAPACWTPPTWANGTCPAIRRSSPASGWMSLAGWRPGGWRRWPSRPS
ncbi:hypothetical protein SPURM210S_07290 [Streptomyces purpurascens]